MIDRRKWHWLDWGLFAIHFFWHLLGMYFIVFQPAALGHVPFWPFTLSLLGSFGLPLFFWRQGYVHKGWFPFVVLITSGTLQFYLSFFVREEVGLILFPTLLVAYLAHRSTYIWVLPVYLLAFPLLTSWLISDGSVWLYPDLLLNTFLLFGIGFSFGRILESNRDMQKLLDENKEQYQFINYQNEVLQQYIKEVEALSKLEERNRLAKELHDTVGHTFTSVIMGMDAVHYLMDTAPEEAKKKLDVLREVTRTGLDEIRKNIHQIAPESEEVQLLAYLQRLTDDFALHTQTSINLRTIGTPVELSRTLKMNAIRCIQEALTNAKKHGQAKHIQVVLAYRPQAFHVEIEDDGIGTDKLIYGFGLKSMKDRVQGLNGTLRTTSRLHEGTRVTCTFPL
ncbi:sensor histidine kinase [Marinicrinis sediminis]|uniref:histidine kinase n=1 Tax=Marinicrinis sediminis TaxID=1652465 RepID=A0ABW5R753_9BACL